MKKISLILPAVLLASFVLSLDAALADDQADDRAAVIACVHDYIDGWYDGDVERISRALHPDLMKRTVRSKDGKDFLSPVTCEKMIEYTEAGYGKKSKQEGQVNEVVVLDLLSQTASAKSTSHEFIDYLHLAKIDGKWWIVNVLWEWNR